MSACSESQAMDSGDDTSTSSTDGSESPMTTDNETETEEEENDAWILMVEQAMQKHKTAFRPTLWPNVAAIICEIWRY